MRSILCIVATVLLGARAAFGMGPVVITSIIDPMFNAAQAEQLANLVATAQQAQAIYSQAKMLNDLVGNPKDAFSAMVDTSALVEDLNRQFSGGTSYLSGIPGLDDTQMLMTNMNGGVELQVRLLPASRSAAAKDDQRAADKRVVADQTGAYQPIDKTLFANLDSAEALGRAIKTSLGSEAKAREKAAKTVAKVNDAMKRAQTQSEKQAVASQYGELTVQMLMLNGQLQQQQFEYQLQRDREQRLAEEANLTDQQQAIADANATTAAIDERAAREQRNHEASRTIVSGNPMDLDYTKVR